MGILLLQYGIGLLLFTILFILAGLVLATEDATLAKYAPKRHHPSFRLKERSALEDQALDYFHKLLAKDLSKRRAVFTVAWFILGSQYRRF